MDGFSDRGSTPLRSTKKGYHEFTRGTLFYVGLREIKLITDETPVFGRPHEVRWTSVLRRPERSEDRFPTGLLELGITQDTKVALLKIKNA